jgi:6-phosphogluconate dehydrogenase (decarboxylating)
MMDEDVLEMMNATQKAKEYSLRSLNNSFTHAAVINSRIIDLCMTADSKTNVRQQVTDMAMDSLRILAYGTQNAYHARKENARPVIPAAVKNKICTKKASLEDMHNSHLLFAGEVATKVKKGTQNL